MSARLSDVLPLSIGGYLVLLGAVFLLDSTGVIAIGAAGLVGSAFGLALIVLGVLAVLAALRVRRFSRRLRRAIGHVRAEPAMAIDDAVISTVLGDISLDLREAQLPAGEAKMTLLCWIGAIHVRVPPGVGVSVTAQAIVGTVEALGYREEGILRDISVASVDYESSERRLQLQLSTVVGDLLVVQG